MTEPEALGTLPDAVRSRVIELAATALGRMPSANLPAALKRVAAFAPTRRGKIAANQIASVIANDEEFRERLADQVRQEVSELAEALEAGTTPAAADPVELAAVAYLLRPQGWTSTVSAAADAVKAERWDQASTQLTEQVQRLRRQLDDSAAELRAARSRGRELADKLRTENSGLRHKLADTRAEARSADLRSAAAESAASASATASHSAATAVEAELRRLRTRTEELERDLTTTRRTGRAERDEATLRARLLLDTLLDSAQGLRRELALPTVQGSPADAVAADVAEAGARTPSSHGSLASEDPVLLDQLLNLPRVHLIVDGYNVTKSRWPDSSLETQRDRLLSGLAPVVARTRAEVSVVFDAGDVAQRPVVNRPRGVRVLFSPLGVIADDVIRDLVAAEPQGRPVVVVSSDHEVVRDVLRSGARTVAAAALSNLLARA